MRKVVTLIVAGALVASFSTAAIAEPVSRNELVGVWVGYTDGNEPPGWFMELRDDGTAFFFGRSLKKSRNEPWLIGVPAGVPDYLRLQTAPILKPDGQINGHLTSLFHNSKIPEYRKQDFDYSEMSQLEVVMEAHGGAFALGVEPNGQYLMPDFWTAKDQSIAIKGNIFDVDMNDGILGLYPHRICPYDDTTIAPAPFPDCDDTAAINWRKADKPTFTWVRVEGELLQEYKVFSAVSLLHFARAGSSEAVRPQYRWFGHTQVFEDILEATPEILDHPQAGPKLLAQSMALPVERHVRDHSKMAVLLERGFARWLSEKMPVEDLATMPDKDMTLCEFFSYHGGKRNPQAKVLYDQWCAESTMGSTARRQSPATPGAADGVAATDPKSGQNASATRVATVPSNTPSAGTETSKESSITAPLTNAANAQVAPDWEIVGFWDYDGVDGMFVPEGFVLKEQPGSAIGVQWRWQIALKKHAELRQRNRTLFPVWLNRKEKKVCVDAPYPTYEGYVDLQGQEYDGVYSFASCKGGSQQ